MCNDCDEHDTGDLVLAEACRLAERNLDKEMQLALAADQRATSFTGLVLASISITIGLSDEMMESLPLIVAVLLLAISAVLSGAAARPTMLNVSFQFRSFETDLRERYSIDKVRRQIGEIYDDYSDENRKVLKFNSRLFRTSLVFAGLGLAAALISFIPLPTG